MLQGDTSAVRGDPAPWDEAIDRMLEAGRARAAANDAQHARLWDALAAATRGGKRFRPVLVMAAHDAFGGDQQQAAAAVGAAVELMHTAFVIHDDLIDGDDVRRGRPNVSGTFRASALGDGASVDQADSLARTAGILAGDLALAASVRAVATCGASEAVTHELLDLFDAALHTTAAGELADVRLSMGTHAATLEESLAMAEQKTSAYSFALPLRAGAVLAGAEGGAVERLGRVGRSLGIAFQLFDDLIGVFGDPRRTGKSATSDLRTVKQTPLLTHARSTGEWTRIRTYLGRELTQDELGEVRALLTTSGSREFVDALAAGHQTAARSEIEQLGVSMAALEVVLRRPPALAGSDEVAA
ncbi:polyprenyl synthetase family protein [Nocardioides currus]|nr:polyprenyl synthetase family protein [Nocardioides currus]